MAGRQTTGIRVGDVSDVLERIAPLSLAAEWDNVGLLIGQPDAPVRRLILTIDLTEDVLDEVVRAGAEMVMAYHPVIFKPISRVSGVVLSAAQAGVAVYSMHTALDAAAGGTNDVLAEAIGIAGARPLQPQAGEPECKLVVFVPERDLAAVTEAAFGAGAGRMGRYTECAFRTPGTGTFRGEPGSRPAVGRPGRREEVQEWRVEMVCPRDRLGEVLSAVRAAHSYETPAIDVVPLAAAPGPLGMGRIGRLKRPMEVSRFVGQVKRALGVRRILRAGRDSGKVGLVACAAGSAGSLYEAALAAEADAYVTGEMRHHDALAAAAAENRMMVLCVGHTNSERPVLAKLADRLRRELPALQVSLSRFDRDPFRIA